MTKQKLIELLDKLPNSTEIWIDTKEVFNALERVLVVEEGIILTSDRELIISNRPLSH